MSKLYKNLFLIISLLISVLIIYALLDFSSLRSNIKKIMPQFLKEKIKHMVIGKEKYDTMKKLYDQQDKINYNFIELPKTQFLDLDFKSISLENLNLNQIPSKDNLMFVKPATTSFFMELYKEDLVVVGMSGNIFFINKKKLMDNKIETSVNPNINYQKKISKVLDLLIFKEKIFISYATRINDDCLNVGIMMSDIDSQNMNFKEIFLNEECVKSTYAGKMAYLNFDNKDGFLLSLDALSVKKDQAQNLNSNLGKILFIEFNSFKTRIFSYGHRNPQGIFVDNNRIISTEHGPRGGDEINIINFENNYGWPISSYGEPYDFEDKTKEIYHYKKNHSTFGFEEPVFTYVPSIGISQLIKIPKKFSKKWEDDFLISSLNSRSLFRVKFDNDYQKIIFSEKIYVGERIRDIIFDRKDNLIFLALEESGSLGLLKNN